jgi:glycosyltransferase involved in cell wall biosynthesis
MQTKKGFHIYFDNEKTTSGQRFYRNLKESLINYETHNIRQAKVVLFNISAPIFEIIQAKIRRQIIVLRVDGLYADKLTNSFLKSFSFPFRIFFNILIKFPFSYKYVDFIANLINENYTGFIRILLSDYIVYQSLYSKQVHQKYFPNKQFTIINNAASLDNSLLNKDKGKSPKNIVLITIHDGWKPAKRIDQIIKFVVWANEQTEKKIILKIIGYNNQMPVTSDDDVLDLINSKSYILKFPKFSEFTDDLKKEFLTSDIYISFSYKDPCPNAVIEGMSFVLPVVAFDSGGMKDIVGNAGILLDTNETNEDFYSSHRFDNCFFDIKYEIVLDAINKIMSNYRVFKNAVESQFSERLEIRVVSNLYLKYLNSILDQAK